MMDIPNKAISYPEGYDRRYDEFTVGVSTKAQKRIGYLMKLPVMGMEGNVIWYNTYPIYEDTLRECSKYTGIPFENYNQMIEERFRVCPLGFKTDFAMQVLKFARCGYDIFSMTSDEISNVGGDVYDADLHRRANIATFQAHTRAMKKWKKILK